MAFMTATNKRLNDLEAKVKALESELEAIKQGGAYGLGTVESDNRAAGTRQPRPYKRRSSTIEG